MTGFGVWGQPGVVIGGLLLIAGLLCAVLAATVVMSTSSSAVPRVHGWSRALLGVPVLVTVLGALPGTLNHGAALVNLSSSAVSGAFGAVLMARAVRAQPRDVKVALVVIVVGGAALVWFVLAALIAVTLAVSIP